MINLQLFLSHDLTHCVDGTEVSLLKTEIVDLGEKHILRKSCIQFTLEEYHRLKNCVSIIDDLLQYHTTSTYDEPDEGFCDTPATV